MHRYTKVCTRPYEQEEYLLFENILSVLVNYTNAIVDLYQNLVDLSENKHDITDGIQRYPLIVLHRALFLFEMVAILLWYDDWVFW